MSIPAPAELKRKLRAAGFEVYRSSPQFILLAERVRDNLIMDSGVAAKWDREQTELFVSVTVRAQASHFPGADDERIWEMAQELSTVFVTAGYQQQESRATPVPDPNDPDKSLDTSHEIHLRKVVTDLDDLFSELRAALGRPRSTTDD